MNIVSLFSGCGGLDLGFTGGFTFQGRNYERLNTNIVFANDFDTDATTCYNSNILLTNEGEECLLEDIRNINAEAIPDFDILIAGFPCQPFSNAGNRKGVNDANGRGTLFEECERIIEAKIAIGHRPKAFVFENVRGILSSKMPDGVTTVPEEIKQRMQRLGYNISMKLVCSSDYGVPQQRYRVFIIGIDNELGIGCFNFDLLNEVVNEYNIPSKSLGNVEDLLLGVILQGVENLHDNVVWEYSASTQRTVDLIGGCQHGLEAFQYFRAESPYSCAFAPRGHQAKRIQHAHHWQHCSGSGCPKCLSFRNHGGSHRQGI